jgi:predicted DNA-binding mobile mystery protein A
MGVTPAAIRQMEGSERAGTIKLQTLERAASAMNAELGYVVMPMQSLDAQVRSRAELVARRELEQVNHSMALEDQRPDPHRDAVIVADRVRELVADRRLWVDP